MTWWGRPAGARLVVVASVLAAGACAPPREDRDISRAQGSLAINLSGAFDIERTGAGAPF
jgi:hypothetical protein